MGDCAGALADLDRADALQPGHAITLLVRGATKHGMGDFAGAITDLDRATALDPRNADTLYVRGVTRLARGDRTGAAADLGRANALRPGDLYIHASLLTARAEVMREPDFERSCRQGSQEPSTPPRQDVKSLC